MERRTPFMLGSPNIVHFFSTDLEKSYNSRGGGIDFDEIILKYHLGKKCMRTANKILKSKSIL